MDSALAQSPPAKQRADYRQCLNLKERGSVSRSTVENQNITGPFLRSLIADPLRVAAPRSVPLGQIKTLPNK
jgi:hypothetical protein